MIAVTPYAGVWIEISSIKHKESFLPSLPTRECGLKWFMSRDQVESALSLPTRECGLKFLYTLSNCVSIKSLPTRECGLKF